jgi:excisionase family DNA binding protein
MQSNAQIRDGLKNKAYLSRRAAVCLRTVDYWIANNLIPYVKFGAAVRFSLDDIEAFIASHRVTSRKDRARTRVIAHKSNQIRKARTRPVEQPT